MTDQSLDLLKRVRTLHLQDGCTLVRVGFNASGSEHESKKLSRCHSESAFSGIQPHPILPALLEDLLQVFQMLLFVNRPDHHVVDVHIHAPADLICEKIFHQALICGSDIL